MEELINKAVSILNSGGLVIFPTDTVFGIGCRIDRPDSVKRLFSARRRPEKKAVPVLVSAIEMAEKYFLSPLPNNVRHLMNVYWPGALTIVYNVRIDKVTPLVRGNGKTIGIRMPKKKLVLEIIRRCGVALLGPSANFHRFPAPANIKDLDPELARLVDLVIPGESPVGQASTVVDCISSPWKIIRQGSVMINQNDLTY